MSFPSHSHHLPPPHASTRITINSGTHVDQYEQDQYEQDPLQDPLKYEHTAISHFLQWHSAEGARVPAFQRKGERSLSAVFQARAG